MKTLHVTHRIYPEYNGGTEIHVYELCKDLAKNNEETIIFTQFVNPNAKKMTLKVDYTSNMTVYRVEVPDQSTKRKLLYHIVFYKLFLVKTFYTVLRTEKPDIVHFHHLVHLSSLLFLLAWLKGIPRLVDLVDYWFLCPNGSLMCNGSTSVCGASCIWSHPLTIREVVLSRIPAPMLRVLYGFGKVASHKVRWRLLFQTSGTVLLPISRRTREIYATNGMRNATMTLKPCGIRLPKLPDKPHSRNALTIGYLGTMLPPKGVHVLIAAVKKLRNPDIRLLLYGQNAYPKSALERLIQDDSRIQLRGAFDHKDVYKILGTLDVLVVPSIWEETFCLVVQEGLAAHVPVITSRIGGMPERIHEGVNGFLVTPNDKDELSQQIQYVISNYAKLHRRLRYDVGQYTLTQETRHVMTIYQEVVANKPVKGTGFSSRTMHWEETV